MVALKGNPIRRVRHHGIDLAERRKYLPAIPEVEDHAFGQCLDTVHCEALISAAPGE
jgi:hypothetical protein